MKVVGIAVVVCALSAASADTRAADSLGFAIDRFEPAGGGSEWFSLESLDFRGHLRPAFGLVADLALNPVVIYDASGRKVSALVSGQATLHADAALVLSSRVRFDLNAPAVLWHDGAAGMLNGVSYAPPTGQPLGDVRLGADHAAYLGEATAPITVAAGAQVFVPAGHQIAFTGDGARSACGRASWP